MRIRGTRVWIFCPSTSTRARISDSIWTPLLVPAVVVEVLFEETLRLVSGRADEIRLVEGCAFDRVVVEKEEVWLVDRGLKPAR